MDKIKQCIDRFRKWRTESTLNKKRLRAVRIIRNFVMKDKERRGRIYLLSWASGLDDHTYKKIYHVGDLKIRFERYIRGDVVEVVRLDTNELIMEYVDQSYQYSAFDFPHDIKCFVTDEELIKLMGDDFFKPDYNKIMSE